VIATAWSASISDASNTCSSNGLFASKYGNPPKNGFRTRRTWLIALESEFGDAHQGWSANIFTTASDMFPGEYVGTVVSFGQVGGALGGAIFAAVAGHILQFSHSYILLFLYSAFAYLLALVLLRSLAPGLKPAALTS
jgi:ACS family hexuronate transporter-like MFS transporter